MQGNILMAVQPPQFPPGGVPIEIAAEVYGKAPTYIHEGLRAGWLPIGYAKEGRARVNYYVSPFKLWLDTGFVYQGQTLEEVKEMRKGKGEER